MYVNAGAGFSNGVLFFSFGYVVMTCLGHGRCNIGFPLNFKVDDRASYIDKGMYYASGQRVRTSTGELR